VPKERIYATGDPTYREAATPDDEAAMAGVELQWSQFEPASDNDAAVAIATGHLNLHLEQLGEGEAGKAPISTPYFVWLNRRQINKLISDLRRARRAMYGDDQ
jgi:hypothetical protein